MTWTQIYDPFQNPWLSTLVAALPTVLLLGLLATGRASAQLAALAGLVAALVTAIFVYVPEMGATASYGDRVTAWAPTMLAAAANGAAFGLLPIGWIVLAAIFLYNLTVAAGQFEIIKHSVASLSDDRRLQALLIAFSFGAFIEGAAGFGTPVAISAALMMGAGFKPLFAAGLALLANTSPVAFGALGTPIQTLARITNLPELELSAMAGRQLPFFSLIIPAWLVWVMAGWRGVLGVWPALVVCGGSFALVQFLVANYHGPWLVDVAGGLVSLVCLALFLRVWQPKVRWHFAGETPPQPLDSAAGPRYTRRQVVRRLGPVGTVDGARVPVGPACHQDRPRLTHQGAESRVQGGHGSGLPSVRADNGQGSGTSPEDRTRPARRDQTRGRGRHLRRQLAVRDRHQHLHRGHPVRILAQDRPGPLFVRLLRYVLQNALAPVHHCLHVGHRLYHALQRHGRHAGPRLHAYRRFLSDVRGPAWAGSASP